MLNQHDVLIIGSGAAGLSMAIRLAKSHKVAVLSKVVITEGSTMYAQGGISAVIDDDDSVAAHVEDTLIAGAGICDKAAVEHTVKGGADAIQWLKDINVPFTLDDEPGKTDQLHLTREGGHSHRRVAHAADATGRAIEVSMVEAARQHENIELFEHHMAVDLITRGSNNDKYIAGAYVLDRNANHVEIFQAKFVVLACGGASKVYLYTSNPDGSTGDGIAMAWRAGCSIANMEFMQFHPTCLYHPQAKSFLISEALRGEGAILTLEDGTRFMEDFDERMELAPRDIVARAIDHEMKRLGTDNVYLDISHKPPSFINDHFPNIQERCKKYGFDLTTGRIPVVPAAHYTCGGVVTDLNGRTDISNLYAVGEASCTGLHGANRLASNSLLECLVFGKAAATDIENRETVHSNNDELAPWDESRVTDPDERVVVTHNWDELRRFMWDYVGIVRTTKRLERAQHRVDLLNREIYEFYSNFRITGDLIELRNLVLVADLIIKSALSRHESRGLHFTRDYPDENPYLDNVASVLTPPHR